MNNVVKKISKKVMPALGTVSPTLVTRVLFRKYLGMPLNLKNPRTLNEKMQWLKLNVYNHDPKVTQCVDKYRVREYIKDCGREDLLVKLYGVWDSADEIDFDKLPTEFVLKCNHGSGSIIICRDKTQLNIDDIKRKLNAWMKEDFGIQRAEMVYKNVQRKIICEELINTQDGKAPKDYKFFCSYGIPKFLFVASDRNGEHAYFDYFSLDWEHYDVINEHPHSPVPLGKPDQFQEMIKAAGDIAGDFPIVRVDLYNENGKVYFGELTFLHFGGLHPFIPAEFDTFFGDMLPLNIR